MNKQIVDTQLNNFKQMVHEEDIKFDVQINENKENYKIYKDKAKAFEEQNEQEITHQIEGQKKRIGELDDLWMVDLEKLSLTEFDSQKTKIVDQIQSLRDEQNQMAQVLIETLKTTEENFVRMTKGNSESYDQFIQQSQNVNF